MSVYRLTEPPLSVSVEPRTPADRDRMSVALDRLAVEGLPVVAEVDRGSGRMILRADDERRLDAVVDRLLQEFGVEAAVGSPRVAYRETVANTAERSCTHNKYVGPMGQFAEVGLRVEPGGPEDGYALVSVIGDQVIPAEYRPGIERGVKSVMEAGPLAACPVIGVTVTLLDGRHHPVDSSILSFEIASRVALRDALRAADPKLLEPIMAVEVLAPKPCVEAVRRDLVACRGVLDGQDRGGETALIRALVPLATLMGYPNGLAHLTGGRGSVAAAYVHHAPVEPSGQGPDDRFPPAVALRA